MKVKKVSSVIVSLCLAGILTFFSYFYGTQVHKLGDTIAVRQFKNGKASNIIASNIIGGEICKNSNAIVYLAQKNMEHIFVIHINY